MARRPRQIGAHLNQRVSHLTSRLDQHKLALGLLVAAVGAFLAYIAFVSTTGPPFQSRYQIEVEVPADAPPLREGQEVRIGGKLAGLISDVETDTENGGALVTANITKTEFRPLGADATAYVRVHSIVYRTFLELDPGDPDVEPLPDGGRIEQERVSSGVDLLEVVQLFDAETREALRKSVVNVGFGLAGRGRGNNAALAGVEPTAANLRRQLGAATREPGAIGGIVRGAARTTRGLRGVRDDDVAALIGSGSDVLGTVGARSSELGATIRGLRPLEDELVATAPQAEALLDDLAATSVELEPAVRGLNSALPDVARLLALGGELRSESARINAVARPVLRTARPVARELYPLVAALPPLLTDVDVVVDNVTPYAEDISRAGTGLAEATSVPFPFGHGVGVGAPAGRVIPVLTCHANRNPFPAPGEALGDSQAC